MYNGSLELRHGAWVVKGGGFLKRQFGQHDLEEPKVKSEKFRGRPPGHLFRVVPVVHEVLEV